MKEMKQNLNKWRECQKRAMIKSAENQRKRILEKLKVGTFYPKIEFKINKVSENKDIKWYKKVLWRWFSKYIRLRDSDKNGICACITCGRKHLWDSGQIDAGHFIPGSRGNSIKFLEKNVNAQCKYCNKHLHANLAKYRLAIDEKWGPGTADELETLSQGQVIFTEQELIEKINYYKIKVKQLQQKYGTTN